MTSPVWVISRVTKHAQAVFHIGRGTLAVCLDSVRGYLAGNILLTNAYSSPNGHNLILVRRHRAFQHEDNRRNGWTENSNCR
jgi:hypothetical protein